MYSKEEEIKNVFMTRPHVFILGAGATRAAIPNGDFVGNHSPVMDDLVKTLGLEKILRDNSIDYEGLNFEALYSQISADPKHAQLLSDLETEIDNYFNLMALPEEPTIYDYLLLSLREKDVVATFNWDPLILHAYDRNRHVAKMPQIRLLHGNVKGAHCLEHNFVGGVGSRCPKCAKNLTKTPLLFPVSKKDYTNDPFIKSEWDSIQHYLKDAFMLTVFGYSAPVSDVDAVELMKNAWTGNRSRELLETEIIDIKSKQDLESTWEPFLFSHHYQMTDDFFESWLATHPRRSCEAIWQVTMEAKFLDGNPVARFSSLEELHQWFQPLIKAEDEAK